MNRRLAAVLVAGLAVAVLSPVAATVAEAAPVTVQSAVPTPGPGLNLKPGKNHQGTLHAGAWTYAGKAMYCISYGLQGPDGAVKVGSSALGLAPADAPLANTIVNAYGTTRDNHQAAAVWTALASLIARNPQRQPTADMQGRAVKLRADLPGYLSQLTAADRTLVAKMLGEETGPYTVKVALTGAVVGQQGRAVATVTGSHGRAAVSRQVAWMVNGGTVTSAGKVTDTRGQAVVSFKAAANAQAVTATLTAPSSTAVLVNAPSKGHQLVLAGGYTETARGSDVAELCPVTLTVTKRCACDKTGAREVSFTFTAEDYPGAYTVTVEVGGKPVASSPLPRGGTVTLTATVRAGDDVAAVYSISGTTYRETLDGWSQR